MNRKPSDLVKTSAINKRNAHKSRGMSNSLQGSSQPPSGDWVKNLAAATACAFLWLLTGCMLAGRIHLAYRYAVVSGLPGWAEPLLAPGPSMAILFGIALLAPLGQILLRDRVSHWEFKVMGRLLVFQLMACMPLFLTLLRDVILPGTEPNFWEMLWFVAWTGIFVYKLILSFPGDHVIPNKVLGGGLLGLCIAQVLGWVLQSYFYYDAFMLGFNDAGHFTQRIANTVNGNGLLLETPVLPMFWDHFNPGLLLLAPIWMIAPDVQTLFWVQPIAVALCAWLLFLIAREKKLSMENSLIWGTAWLALPVVGQINIAYTYSWHPVVLGIPFLFLSYLSYLKCRYWSAAAAAVIACSFEEGIIVVIGCFAAARAIQHWFQADTNLRFKVALPWIALWAVSVVGFLLVYSLSGLADFQSARFTRLGNSLGEILLSPITRPSEFWGLLLRPRNFVFLAIWFLPALVIQGGRWAWSWIAIAPPMFVLLVWEHEPAQSIAFQYTSTLLPLLVLGCLETHVEWIERNRIIGGAESAPPVAFFITALTLSVFVGQFWWSQDSITDVKGKTYGAREVDGRRLGEEDMVWLQEKMAELEPQRDLKYLCTGRLAMRFVGAKDVETVGQYWVREKQLAEVNPELRSPLEAYDWIVLDHYEAFQQKEDDTKRVSELAKELGYVLRKQAYGFEFWQKPSN